MKSILTAAIAATMVATVSNAAIITNGGQPDISLTEIQQKLDAGEFEHYPGVVRLTATGTRYTAAGNNYLFKKTFKPGMALPKVVDMVALQRAVAKSEVILVASRDLILPTPAIFVEIGRQNGVDPVAFMQHYIEATTDIDSDAFGIHAKAQTMATIQALGLMPQGITVDVEALMAAGVAELEAERLAHLATQVALQEAQARVATLTTAQTEAVIRETSLIMQLNEVQSRLSNEEAQVALYADDIHDLEVRVGELETEVATLEAEVERLNARNTANAVILGQTLHSIQAKNREISRLTSEIATKTARIATLEAQHSANAAEHNRLMMATRAKDREIATLEAEVASLRAQVSATIPTPTTQITREDGMSYDNPVTITARPDGTNELSLTIRPGTALSISAVSEFRRISNEVQTAIHEMIRDAYDSGYDAGFTDGYAQGFTDGLASARGE